MRSTRATVASAGATVLVGLVLAGVASADRWLPATSEVAVSAPVATVAPSSVTLVCPPGMEDPAELGVSVASPGAWVSTNPAAAASTAPLTITAEATDGVLDIPTGVVVAGQGGGELRGLSLSPCTAATGDQWIASGATTVGEDLVLVLANPAAANSVVTVDVIGASGPIAETGQSVVVPAGGIVAVMPATWAPDEERPALHITSGGPGVAAWVQSSGLDGEVPTGATWAASTQPATHQILPGISAEDGARVRLAVPGSDSARVTLSVAGADGTSVLSGAQDIDIEAGTALEVDLAGIPDDATGLVVDADVPVIAQASLTRTGQAWPDSESTWSARSSVGPSSAVTEVDLPAASTISTLVHAQLSASVLRNTTVTTSSGPGTDATTAEVVLVNDSQVEATEVTVGGTTVEVGAGATMTVDLPGTAGTLSATLPVHAALVVRASTANGPVSAVWALGATGLSQTSLPVDVLP